MFKHDKDGSRLFAVPAIVVIVVVVSAMLVLGASLRAIASSHLDNPAVSTAVSQGALGKPPNFAGKVLHWAQINYTYEPNQPDPANGKAITADIWVWVGNDGTPSAFVARYYLPDGTLHQQSIWTPTESITIFGSDYRSLPGYDTSVGQPCVQRGAPNPHLSSAFPLYVDPAALVGHGFVSTQASPPSHPVPTTIRPTTTSPAEIFKTATPANVWQATARQDGKTSTNYAAADSSGRLTMQQSTTTDADGTILRETWLSVGDLDVYGSSQLPASVVASLQSQEKGC